MSVDSKMTAIADKIRGLRGLTGTMGLDAMATNLQAEQTSITNALAALADKGVTVPDGSTSDALAGLIEALETGGGGKVVSGTFTLSEDTTGNNFYLEHGLGVRPNIILIAKFYTGAVADELNLWVAFNQDGKYESRCVYSNQAEAFKMKKLSYGDVDGNERIDDMKVNKLGTNYDHTLTAGEQYLWCACG